MQKVDKGYFSPPPSIPPSIHPFPNAHLLVYPAVLPCTRVSVSPTQCRVLIYCVARRLCLCETAFTRRSFTRSRASLLVHPPTMRTCKRPKSVRDLRGRAQFGKCMENGESEMSSRSVKSHSLWPESSTGGASSDPLMKETSRFSRQKFRDACRIFSKATK